MVFRKQNTNEILNYISTCGTELVEIKPYRKTRSNRQNDLYWSIVEIASQECGHTKDEMHEIFKQMFIPVEEVALEGYIFEVRKSTSVMNTKEFSDYLDMVYSFCIERDFNLPTFEDYNL